jgi:uncharacterized protein (UPF0332 family)/predicted nucleotidyltransferase
MAKQKSFEQSIPNPSEKKSDDTSYLANSTTQDQTESVDSSQLSDQVQGQMPVQPFAAGDIPIEAQEKMKEIQSILEQFKEKLVDRFEGYISAVALLPPNRLLDEVAEMVSEEQLTKLPDNHINALVLIDDTTPSKLSKEELKERLTKVVGEIAQSVNSRIYPQTILQSELMQYCFDCKYAVMQFVASSAPVLDRGMLSAFKIAEVHKHMVLKKFEKYIVSYVLAGSLVQGRATAQSDIDVFIVIDDTDVKRMSRVELKDKLRSIIIGMGQQAGEMTGVRNKLNIQTYILTDFWDSIKEANPVIFTFLRDGVPFYDRGIFMPWKQLLRMGKVKPSMEAIDMYMSTGEQMLERTKFKLKEIAMEDAFWSILYPSQAALMLYGLPPPTPKETPELLRKVFVKKEKLLEDKFVKILENNIQLRKDLEHGESLQVTGVQLDKALTDAASFLVRIRKLFDDLDERQQGNGIAHTYDHVMTIVRDILSLDGLKDVSEKDLLSGFEKKVIQTAKMPQRILTLLQNLEKAKKEHDAHNLHRSEIEKIRVDSQELIRALVDYIQRSRGIELERAKIRVKYGDTFGEVVLFEKIAFIVHNLDSGAEISKAVIDSDGRLSNVEKSSYEEYEKELITAKFPQRVFIKDHTLVDLKKIFGKDVEVLLTY